MPIAPLAAHTQDTSPVTRVLIVDDSAVIRGFITRALQDEPSIRVVGSASNGEIAVDTLRRQPADVVILDIEMPVMDGLTAIPKLKAIDAATQIVMASTLTHKNAEVSLKALSLGATDYVAKPSSREISAASDFHRELIEKVKALGAIARRKGVRTSPEVAMVTRAPVAPVEKKPVVLRPLPAGLKPAVIAIGSSTGGPQALFEVIKNIGAGMTQPIVITQHMPPAFTTILAEHIAKQCAVNCVEAKDGDVLRAGQYYIAPGDNHMLITKRPGGPTVHLVKDAPENFCRPAVDPMLRSLIEVYGGHILTVILTGMGQDGWKGSDLVVKAGGAIIAQDEPSSVVWGMPGAVATAGICSYVMPVTEIGAQVRKIAVRA
jgi:two-component system chemotaxis response regulator CheB